MCVYRHIRRNLYSEITTRAKGMCRAGQIENKIGEESWERLQLKHVK